MHSVHDKFCRIRCENWGEGSPWFCSPENSYHLNLFIIKIQKWHEGDPWRLHLMRSHKFDFIKISSSLVKPTRYPSALHIYWIKSLTKSTHSGYIAFTTLHIITMYINKGPVWDFLQRSSIETKPAATIRP